ncbi:Ribonuclease toxin, BrnT, of type II toxin-antitoxin system [Pedococcus dokdonensis]|uniref:Ribonuclease toxin, BrnT, of type II toxin-antitoxin system n=1 Tax=Pedococcus dokdonensis TaxID=443156 RepID=A0A1H0LWG0_9MICO|nr:Ribonuclease toxin, BrnT, of type II toxin-antitoxin system [Pedococcus dokdonensis]
MSHPSQAEWLDIDEFNEAHIAEHHVSPTELYQVMSDEPLWSRNKNGMTAEWRMIGRTYGGRPIVAAVKYDESRGCIRPITARECTAAEVTKWGI